MALPVAIDSYACHHGLTDWGVGKYMDGSSGRRHNAIATAYGAPLDSPELRRLAEARTALDRARRKAKWRRKCKDLHSAEHAVHVASVAARNAGIGWTQIGDVLGIVRATTPTGNTQIGPPHASPDTGSRRHRPNIVAARSRHYSEDASLLQGQGMGLELESPNGTKLSSAVAVPEIK
jgi:hypothetical protein